MVEAGKLMKNFILSFIYHPKQLSKNTVAIRGILGERSEILYRYRPKIILTVLKLFQF